MTLSICSGGDKPCEHLAYEGGNPYCAAFARPVEDVQRCGTKLVKAALKKRKLEHKLKGKKP